MSQVGAVGLNAQRRDISLPDHAPEWNVYWHNAQSHRETVTRLILNSAPRGASLCVWGAGSCHDLNLPELAEHFHTITLADINTQNTQWGVEFQSLADAEHVQPTPSVDLSGVIRWKQEASSNDSSDRLESFVTTLKRHTIPELGKYDLVVSTGMLSQVIVDIEEIVSQSQEELLTSAIVAARRRHLQLMTEHLKPQGVGLLITDILNTDDVPELATTSDLNALVNNVFKSPEKRSSLTPTDILQDLLVYPPIATRVSQVANTDYWLWEMTRRVYACLAVQFQLSTKLPGARGLQPDVAVPKN